MDANRWMPVLFYTSENGDSKNTLRLHYCVNMGMGSLLLDSSKRHENVLGCCCLVRT